MNESDSCDGCVMAEDDEWCSIVKEGREKNCPCRTCLIKVMCTYSCNEYQIYIDTSKEREDHANQ